MLVLARKWNETIHIGDDITIVVTEITGGTVRLGIKAPPDVSILRGELYVPPSPPAPKPKPRPNPNINPKDKRR